MRILSCPVLVVVVYLIFLLEPTSAGVRYELLHEFGGGSGPQNPRGALVAGPDGNFYGVSEKGGAGGHGTVFRMTRQGTITVLVEFTGTSGVAPGRIPLAGLAVGSDGLFYGTTSRGGAADKGTVFRLTTAGVFTSLAQFTGTVGPTPGYWPSAPLTPVGATLYGTTEAGGSADSGVVFSVTTGGAVAMVVEFTQNSHGRGAQGALVPGQDGSLYGATRYGGGANNGTVFRVSPATKTLSILTQFAGPDVYTYGYGPTGGLTKGADGAIYGTTIFAATGTAASLFRIDSAGVLSRVSEWSNYSRSPVTTGPGGALYGLLPVLSGRPSQVFKLGLNGTFSSVLNLTGLTGSAPGEAGRESGGVLAAEDGTLYASTDGGGSAGTGVIFRVVFTPDLTPQSPSNRSRTGVTLNGFVNPGDFATVVHFEYGTAASYGSTTEAASFAAGSGSANFSAPLTGLSPHTTYYYRAVASNSNITTSGQDQTFTTLNSLPIAGDDVLHTPGTGGAAFPIAVLENDSDADNDSLTIQSVTNGAHGAVTTDGASLTYTPDAGFEGSDSFSYTVVDGFGGKATATVTLQNQIPMAMSDTLHPPATLAPFNITVLQNDGDADSSDSLFIDSVTDGSFGTVSTDGKSIVYTPGPGYSGTDTFFYTISDGRRTASPPLNSTARASVTLSNTAPQALADIAGTTRGPVTVSVLENDTDSDADAPLTIVSVTQGTWGTVTTDGTTVTYIPGPQFKSGDAFSYFVTDGRGAVATAQVTVRLSDITTDRELIKGDQVPGEPAGSTFSSFGVPSINSRGMLALRAGIRRSNGERTSGIFAGAPIALVARKDGAASGIAGARFRTFIDPILNEAGHVAFVATVSGTNKRADSGIWSTGTEGQLKLVAREGTGAPGTHGAMFSRFEAIALPDTGRVIFAAALAIGIGDVTASDNSGVWGVDPQGALQLILRKGDLLNAGGVLRRVDTIGLFDSPATAAGQRRGFNADGDLLVRIRFVDRTETLLRLDDDGDVSEIASSGMVSTSGSPGALSKFSVSGLADDRAVAFRATLADTVPHSGDQNGAAIIRVSGDGVAALVIEEGDTSPVPPGFIFSSIDSPIISRNGQTAFLATLRGVSTSIEPRNGRAICIAAEETPPRVIVRQGDPAPSVEGAKFAAFNSLVFPGLRGVAFVGVLARGKAINSANDTGLWAQDSSGNLRLLVREGQSINKIGNRKTIKSFTAFSTVRGSPGQGHGYTSNGGFVCRAIFTDGSQGILSVWVP